MPIDFWSSTNVGATPADWVSVLTAWGAVLAATAFIGAVVAISRPIRTLASNPALPGAVGAGIGFMLTQESSLSVGWWHHVAVAVTVVVVGWAIVAVLANISRERTNKRRRFAREAFRFAREVYNLIDEPKSLCMELEKAGGWDPEISARLQRAQSRACSEYSRQYWIPLRNFFDEIKDEGFVTDMRVHDARELANTIEQFVFGRDDWNAIMKIEEMGAVLDYHVGSALRQREPFFQWPWRSPESLGD